MQEKLSLRGFTLTEILVVIVITAVVILGASQLNFARLSQEQKIDIEVINISNIFEEVRNNALIGRSAGASGGAPDSWEIEFSQNNSGALLSSYSIAGTKYFSDGLMWQAPSFYGIQSIKCLTLDGSEDTLSGTGSIAFTGSLMSLSGTNCDDPRYKVLSITFGNTISSKTLTFNTLSGVLEIN